MQSKIIFAISCLLFVFSGNAQMSHVHTFGKPSQGEFNLDHYPPDPEAAGIVLYERGNYTVDQADGYIRLIKEVHRKIKVLDAKNFKHASVEIDYYHKNHVRENITNLQAITHNGQVKKYVAKNSIFDTDEGPNWAKKKFTFPDVQDGSILEYTYRIETPYFSNIGGWAFMNELPTLYSELHTEIPGNFRYNRTLYGSRQLDINHAEIIKSCFHLPGFKVPGDCESATYAMKNLPAFKEENYMLSSYNYIPSLKFELVETFDLNESRTAFAKTWGEMDREFRYDRDLGRQLKYTNYFKEKLPPSVLSLSNDLERAKAVYYFVQSSINWNRQVTIFSEARVKEAFDKGAGNSSEINLGLINALEAAGLDAKIMLIATRNRALPTKQYPVLTDFNYVIVFLTIDNKKYLLDATEKYAQFGALPIRALNVEGRVLDFKKGSYWEPIVGSDRNMHYATLQLEADENGYFSGKINEVSTGQIALPKRKASNQFTKEEIVKRKQSENEFLNISELQIENDMDFEQPYKESYNITLHEQAVASILFLYPFQMTNYIAENPFKKEKREYPIDFGFPVTNNYLVSIDVKDQYEIVKVPTNRILKLPENDGELSVVYEVAGSKVNIRLNMKLNTTAYSPEAHTTLREFFETLVKIQSEEPLELKKI